MTMFAWTSFRAEPPKSQMPKPPRTTSPLFVTRLLTTLFSLPPIIWNPKETGFPLRDCLGSHFRPEERVRLKPTGVPSGCHVDHIGEVNVYEGHRRQRIRQSCLGPVSGWPFDPEASMPCAYEIPEPWIAWPPSRSWTPLASDAGCRDQDTPAGRWRERTGRSL